MKFEKYESRFKAGIILATFIKQEYIELYQIIQKKPKNAFCFAIPNGGVPVSEGFCEKLNLSYDILIVRKIKIPYNPEAGFGSMTTDGTILINQTLLRQLSLNENELNRAVNETTVEIEQRLKAYNKIQESVDLLSNNIQNQNIFILDDGLASGFTMLAAIKMIKKYDPKKVFVCAPTAPLLTVQKILKEVNNVICPNIRDTWRFAVAEAYQHWYDLPESEVIEILKKSKYYLR